MNIFFKPFSFYLLICLISGISLGNVFPDLGIFTSIFFFITGLFLLYATLKKKNLPQAACLLFVVVFGCFSMQHVLFPDQNLNHVIHYSDSKKVKITGQIISFKKTYPGKIKVTLDCHYIKQPDQNPEKVTGKIYLSIYNPVYPSLLYGDVIRFNAKLKSIRNFNNPGAFNYEKFLRHRGIFKTAYVNQKNVEKLVLSGKLPIFVQFIQYIEKFRDDLYYFIQKESDRGISSGILISLISGKKEILGTEIRDLFSKAGISHLLAISGLHLTVVGVFFYFFFSRIFGLFKGLLIAGRANKISWVLTLLPIFAYAILCGFSPSTQRAFIMVAVFVTALATENEKDILSSISIAGILILLFDPAALFSISFQLSFAAVFFIVFGLDMIRPFLQAIKNPILYKLIIFICVTFYAGIGTGPLTAHYFHVLSHIQIISNMIAIPVLGFIVLPVGLLGALCFSFFPQFSTLLFVFCQMLIHWIVVLAEFLVEFPFAWTRIKALTVFEIMGLYFVFLGLFLMIKNRDKKNLILVLSGLLVLVTHIQIDTYQAGLYKDLQIIVLDIGQGNSAFVQLPDKTKILVDGGGFSGQSSFDTGRYIIAPFLWQNHIDKIDYVILTHPEVDHIKGLIYILENFEVKTLIKSLDQNSTKSYRKMMKICRKKGIELWHPNAAKRQIWQGDTEIVFFTRSPFFHSKSFNENSLVFKVVYKNFSMLFPGDILKNRENSLSRKYGDQLKSRILLSPHHGSRTSSSQIFLDKVAPESVIISCGYLNRFAFPHKTVIQRYRNMGMNIFRTDVDGAIIINSDGKTYEVIRYKSMAPKG